MLSDEHATEAEKRDVACTVLRILLKELTTKKESIKHARELIQGHFFDKALFHEAVIELAAHTERLASSKPEKLFKQTLAVVYLVDNLMRKSTAPGGADKFMKAVEPKLEQIVRKCAMQSLNRENTLLLDTVVQIWVKNLGLAGDTQTTLRAVVRWALSRQRDTKAAATKASDATSGPVIKGGGFKAAAAPEPRKLAAPEDGSRDRKQPRPASGPMSAPADQSVSGADSLQQHSASGDGGVDRGGGGMTVAKATAMVGKGPGDSEARFSSTGSTGSSSTGGRSASGAGHRLSEGSGHGGWPKPTASDGDRRQRGPSGGGEEVREDRRDGATPHGAGPGAWDRGGRHDPRQHQPGTRRTRSDDRQRGHSGSDVVHSGIGFSCGGRGGGEYGGGGNRPEERRPAGHQDGVNGRPHGRPHDDPHERLCERLRHDGGRGGGEWGWPPDGRERRDRKPAPPYEDEYRYQYRGAGVGGPKGTWEGHRDAKGRRGDRDHRAPVGGEDGRWEGRRVDERRPDRASERLNDRSQSRSRCRSRSRSRDGRRKDGRRTEDWARNDGRRQLRGTPAALPTSTSTSTTTTMASPPIDAAGPAATAAGAAPTTSPVVEMYDPFALAQPAGGMFAAPAATEASPPEAGPVVGAGAGGGGGGAGGADPASAREPELQPTPAPGGSSPDAAASRTDAPPVNSKGSAKAARKSGDIHSDDDLDFDSSSDEEAGVKDREGADRKRRFGDT